MGGRTTCRLFYYLAWYAIYLTGCTWKITLLKTEHMY